MKKNKGTLFFATLKVWEKKVVLLLSILASMPRYWQLVFFLSVSTFGWNHLKVESLFPKYYTVISKVNNQQPSDIVHFLGGTKSKTEIIKSTGCMIPLNYTIQRWQRYTPNKTWYRSFHWDMSFVKRYKENDTNFLLLISNVFSIYSQLWTMNPKAFKDWWLFYAAVCLSICIHEFFH